MERGTLAPIVLFVYNRPEHTRKTLNSINRLPEAGQTDLYIYADQAKNERAQSSVDAVRALVSDFVDNQSHFRSAKLICASANQGLAKSIISGVSRIIDEYGRVIVLEDDLEVAPDFLSYMNGALEYYQDQESIWAISGYTFPMQALHDYPHDVYLSGRGCSWGWATWKDRWETVDWEVKSYPKFKFNFLERKKFAQWGRDLPTMLDAYMYGEIHSWAIRWCYEAFRQHKYTIYPVVSRIKNHGTDGSGTNFNSSRTSQYDTFISDLRLPVTFIVPAEEERIRKEFAAKYMTRVQVVKAVLYRLYRAICN